MVEARGGSVKKMVVCVNEGGLLQFVPVMLRSMFASTMAAMEALALLRRGEDCRRPSRWSARTRVVAAGGVRSRGGDVGGLSFQPWYWLNFEWWVMAMWHHLIGSRLLSDRRGGNSR